MKRMMLAIAAGAVLAGCAVTDDRRPVGVGVSIGGAPAPVGGPPPWAPAHGRRAKDVQRYYYYPAASVYYNVSTGSYFYLNGGSWQVGVSLPASVVIDPGAYVSLELNTDRPYVYYDEHRAKYRGGAGNKHKGGPGRGHGHGHRK